MNNFTFCTPTEFIFGKGVETEVGKIASRYGATKILLVYGGGSIVRSGLLARVEQSLSAANIEYVCMGGVEPNPTDGKVYEGISIARSESVDFLLPVGGGSVIDTAKAIAAGACYDGDFWDFFAGVVPVVEALPVGVILTIPAAGSEGSGNTVITKVDGLHKLSLRTDKVLRPRFAIMNPELTFTLPPYQTACGIADMMVHIMERYFTNTPHVEVTDRICEGLLKAIVTEAPKVIANPCDYDARANIMWCGTMAHNGVCGVGREEDWASHFMEHEVSAVYGVAHGAGLTAIVPAWLTWMVSHHVEKVVQMAVRVFGVEENDAPEAIAFEGIARLKSFWHSLGLPLNLHELGIDNPDIDMLVDKLHENKGDLVGHYVCLSAAQSREIFELAR
ncbi:MAG: iron-containing alcohol dehydrogenase [Bacteroides sp.]|nr:iron-containing alcohol dehydrogenase [Roseburia sp.]MCM1347614.1 iron-containing alcohol dehydrogenase [Bacteroides sp.]MCM1422032.1 iron-containing alcohol dehydrogenase [Bacteroides sp.]